MKIFPNLEAIVRSDLTGETVGAREKRAPTTKAVCAGNGYATVYLKTNTCETKGLPNFPKLSNTKTSNSIFSFLR